MNSREISPERKSLYTVGMVLTGIGILLFLSTFVTFLWHFGDFTNFAARARSDGFRAFGGILLIIVGGVLRNLAARGPAGAGLRLDPDQARKDLEPWSRLHGGLTKDALDEMGIDVPKIADALTDAVGGTKDDLLEGRLRGLHNLYRDGILSEEEYQREKRELLDRE
jgi:hypothetical protein